MLRKLRPASYALLGLSALVLLALFTQTLLLSFRGGEAAGAYVGFHNWQSLFATREFPRLIFNSLILAGLMLGIIPLALCATAGVMAQKSVIGRFVLWAALALPLCIGQTELAAAVRMLFGPSFYSGALSRIPIVYAMMARALPGMVLVALLVDLRFRPGIFRLWGFVAVLGFFWAFARGFALPMDVAQAFVHPLNYDALDTLSFYAYRMGFMQMRLGFGAACEWIAQGAAALLFFAMAAVAALLLPGEDEKADVQYAETPASAVVLALPAVFFMLAPLIPWMARLSQAMPAAEPVSAMPTVATVLGGIVAIPLGFVLAGAIDRGVRVAPVYAGCLCAACGVTLSLAIYVSARGLGLINTLIPIALLSANPVPVAILTGLSAPVVERNGRGYAALWMCAAGAGLIALAFALGANGYMSTLLTPARQLLTVPGLQRAMDAQGNGIFLPGFSLLPLVLGGSGAAMMAMGLKKNKTAAEAPEGA